MALQNDNFIRALLQQPVDRTPVWLMRQAGRYLPEYRAVRKKAGSFMHLCKNPELACQVTMQPLERFDLDAAIIFSDILTIPDAMGLGLYFKENQGPLFEHCADTLTTIEKLPIPDPNQELAYVMEAISLTKATINGKVPLIGFAGSPWTLATYMVEGKSTKSFSKIKAMLYQDPETLHLLLTKLAQATSLYVNAQIEAGAQAIMLFDSWGGVLTPHHYQTFSLNYMKMILDNIKQPETKVPTIVFTKHGGHWIETIAQCGCDAVGVDWTYDLTDIRKTLENKVAIQGNLDPGALMGSPEFITEEVTRIKAAMQGYPGFVFNLGHGIFPETPPENVEHLVSMVHR